MDTPPFGILPLSEGWDRIYKMGVLPLQQSVEGRGSELWGANKFIMVYDLVFKMCIQRDPYNYSEQIYNNYCEAVSTYVAMGEQRLVDAEKKSKAAFLEEFYLRWSRFLTYINRMTKVFGYLDRFYTPNSMVRSTYSEGTHVFGTRVVTPFLDNVLNASDQLYRTKSPEDLNSVRFALAALIDACSICRANTEEALKVLGFLRKIWLKKTAGELLAVLPPYFKGGLVNIIVQYTCPTCFLEKHTAPKKTRVRENGDARDQALGAEMRPRTYLRGGAGGRLRGRGGAGAVFAGLRLRVAAEMQERERRRYVDLDLSREGRGQDPTDISVRPARAEAAGESPPRTWDRQELKQTLRESFLSVFGEQHLECGGGEEEMDLKSPHGTKDGLLLFRHAKELHRLKTMGFNDRRRNLAVLRWTWGNLDEATQILTQGKSAAHPSMPPVPPPTPARRRRREEEEAKEEGEKREKREREDSNEQKNMVVENGSP
mmetsp:Transcript_37517/g.72697  ORF Transcript_37517/g.72697 Transcript_37517/m.72697 type:complete len:486 (+) Transcript_37517:120-1577(+)